MASNYRTDIFLKKLYYIHEQCASARKKKEEEDAEANMDDFTRLRKKIASDIRDAKAVRFPIHHSISHTIFRGHYRLQERSEATSDEVRQRTQEAVNLSLLLLSVLPLSEPAS